jgi:hypothetical protein
MVEQSGLGLGVAVAVGAGTAVDESDTCEPPPPQPVSSSVAASPRTVRCFIHPRYTFRAGAGCSPPQQLHPAPQDLLRAYQGVTVFGHSRLPSTRAELFKSKMTIATSGRSPYVQEPKSHTKGVALMTKSD